MVDERGRRLTTFSAHINWAWFVWQVPVGYVFNRSGRPAITTSEAHLFDPSLEIYRASYRLLTSLETIFEDAVDACERYGHNHLS